MKPSRSRKHRPDTTSLRQVAMFRLADERRLEQVAAHTDVVQVRAGRVVAQAGRPARQFLAVIDGEVGETEAESNSRPLGAGATIGARELLDGTVHPTTVTTLTDTTFVVIEGSAFRWSAHEIAGVADHLSPASNLQPKGTPWRANPLQVRPA
jgi:CRP-like cAMP-binding protein